MIPGIIARIIHQYTPPEPEVVYPFVSVGSTQPYQAIILGPLITTDSTLGNYPAANMGPMITSDNALAPMP